MFEVSEYRDMLCGDEVVWVVVGFVGVGRASYRGRARETRRCEGGNVIVRRWRKRLTAQHLIQDIVLQ